jgi:serine/threonine protein kinase
MVEYVGQKLGNYRLVKLLGRGGFADVYLGEHIYLQTPAAIKVLQVRLTDEALEKFLVEARTVARFNHPNIVSVLEFGIENATPFLVMSYAQYGSLRERHPRGSLLPTTTIVSYVEQVAAALQYAHERQVIHCDVKPENMLLGQNEVLMLSDFGIAISLQSIHGVPSGASGDSLNTSSIVGTFTYMAPEQLQGRPTIASDQYALAAVVYEWICGTPPFRGTAVEIATQHLHTPVPPPREKMPSIYTEVEYVVMRALAKDARARFASIRDFANALRAASASSSPVNRKPGNNSPLSLPYAHAESSLLLSSADFPEDGYISHTVAVPYPDTAVARGVGSAGTPPVHLTEPLRGFVHRVSRRKIIVGLAGLTAAGLVTAFGAERLVSALLQSRISIHPQKPKAEPTATPNVSATAMALINAAETRPAVVSLGVNNLDFFIRDGSGALWHKRYDGAWHVWESLGSIQGDPAVASWGSGRLDIFARGTSSDLQHKWFGGNWHDWESLGGALTSDPAVISSAPGQIDILARGVANGIWYNHFDGSLHDWELQGGVSLSAPAVASSSPGRVDVFVRGADNALWYRWFDGSWNDWTPLGGAFVSDPTVTSWESGRLDVFVRGSDNTLQHKWYDGDWQDWESLGGTLTSSPTAVSWGSNRIDVFARSTNNVLVHKWFDGGWSEWEVFR